MSLGRRTMYKIVPFLAWLHLQNLPREIGTSGSTGLPEHQARCRVHGLAVLLLALAALSLTRRASWRDWRCWRRRLARIEPATVLRAIDSAWRKDFGRPNDAPIFRFRNRVIVCCRKRTTLASMAFPWLVELVSRTR